MKSIKLVKENDSIIRDALSKINGKSYSHTFNCAQEIFDVAERAEKLAMIFLKAQKNAIGVTATAVSGGSVANAYKYTRIGTKITLRRGATQWYLDDISQAKLNSSGGHAAHLCLTPAQDLRAVEITRARYTVKPVSLQDEIAAVLA